jgi:16S rRNA processing protein RimM
MGELFIVAKILRPHGRRGEVALCSFTDHLQTLTGAERFYLGQDPGSPVKVLNFRIHKGTPLVTLDGIDDMDKAESLRGTVLCLPEEELLPLREGEYYLHDLVGMTLLDHRGKEVGGVSSYIETGGAPVLCGKKTDGGSFMVPFAPGTIEEVDPGKKTIRMTNLPGLVDEID